MLPRASNVLEGITAEPYELELHRYASNESVGDVLRGQGLEGQAVDDMTEFLKQRGIDDSMDQFLDGPFQLRRQFGREKPLATRFSDGSFRVFYSSLEIETAEAELRRWVKNHMGQPKTARRAYYTCFSCEFDGSAKDLCTMHQDWPDLTADDYQFCNRLGKEALKDDLDAFLTPSARYAGGTNVPVFKRSAIHSPKVVLPVIVTYDPSSQSVSVAAASSP